jgi:hypothetical protein
MEYLHHSQGVKTETKRLRKIRIVILGKRVRVCTSNFPRVILLEAFEYLRRFSFVGLERFNNEFADHSEFCKCKDRNSRSPERDR